MPIYEYQCGECGHRLEALQKISDAPLKTCPACQRDGLSKLVSASSFRLKGGGWYETDFKTGSRRHGTQETGKGDTSTGDAGKGDAIKGDTVKAGSSKGDTVKTDKAGKGKEAGSAGGTGTSAATKSSTTGSGG